MTNGILLKFWNRVLFLLAVLGLCTASRAATTGAITIIPTGTLGTGSLVVHVLLSNGIDYPMSVQYGQYSSADSVASGIAGKISNDCTRAYRHIV
jgi:hypothetical protein